MMLATLAFIAVITLIPLGVKYAHMIGFLDKPDAPDDGGRKRHDTPIPPVGGLVMFSVFLPCAALSGFPIFEYWGAFAAVLMVLVTGAIDDRFCVNSRIKLVVQVSATLCLITTGGAHLDNLGNMFGFGDAVLGMKGSWIFSFAAVLLLINAVNLSDGLDGLAGGQVFVILGWLLMAALAGGQSEFAGLTLLLMAVVVGFLIYNLRHPFRARASVFMGDAGSMGLGVMVAFLAIHIGKPSGDTAQFLTPMAMAWILALPIMDASAQFIRRMAQRRHPFDPDRGHFHHLLVDAGFSARRSVYIIIALCFVFGALGAVLSFYGWPDVILTVLWALVFGVYTMLSIRGDRFKAFLSKWV